MGKKKTDEEFQTIKVSANQVFKNKFLQSKVNEIVLNCSKASFEAYCFANAHVLRLLEEGKPIPPLNNTFFDKVLSIVSRLNGRKRMECKDEELKKTHERFQKRRPKNYQIAFADNILTVYNYLAKEMETCTSNHLALNFYQRFNKYLMERYPNMSKEERYEICRSLYEETYDGENVIVKHYRQILHDKIPNEKNIQKDPTPILKAYYEILKFIEPLRQNEKTTIQEACERKEKRKRRKRVLRTFSLLPMKGGFKMGYITIDNSVLRDLIIGERLVETRKVDKTNKDTSKMTLCQLRDDITNDTKKYWDTFFNITKYENPKRTFRMLKTDGRTCSLCFAVVRDNKNPKTPKKGASKKTSNSKTTEEKIRTKYNYYEYDDVRSCDPGMKYIATTFDKSGNVFQYSTKAYYHESGTNKTKFQRNACYARNPAFKEYVKYMPSPKTASLDKLMDYTTYALDGLERALDVHFKNPFRKWRFRDFIKKQQTFHRLCLKLSGKTKMNEDKKVLFGMGDWSNPRDSIIRGHRRGPVKELTKELKRYCEVINVQERNTSRCCSHCHHKNDKKEGVDKNTYRVFSCQNCQHTVDRDINAVNNIYMVMERSIRGIQLPSSFTS
jgi:hypothetical protein